MGMGLICCTSDETYPMTDQALGSDGRIGFRAPSAIISPFAKRGRVVHTHFDHTSVLKLIEWR
jgi:phospholipase C